MNERDRRRYAAVEAARLGHGGIEYVSQLLSCDSKIIALGIAELESDEELATDRQRKKGVTYENLSDLTLDVPQSRDRVLPGLRAIAKSVVEIGNRD